VTQVESPKPEVHAPIDETAPVAPAPMQELHRSCRVRRFDRTERVYHWVQAVPYFICLLTGAMILAFADGLHADLTAAMSVVHRYAGGAMLVGIAVVVLAGNRRSLFENARIALTWGRDDLRWFLVYPLEELGFDVQVPPVGKFNPGQKLNLLGCMVLVPVFGATGLMMWFADAVLVAWFAHVAAFAVAVPLIVAHSYLALVHRTTRKGLRGVFDGTVEREWAEEHYPLWVKEQDAREDRERRQARILSAVRERLEHEES